MKAIVEYFTQFVKIHDLKTALNILEKESKKLIKEVLSRDPVCSEVEVRDAFEAVFGNRDNYCENGPCPRFVERIFAFDRELLRGPTRLKCYECDQMMFKKMLEGLAKGKKYSEIPERFESPKYYVASYFPDNIKYIPPGKEKDGKFVYWVHTRETLINLISDAPQTSIKRVFARHIREGTEDFREVKRFILPEWIQHEHVTVLESENPIEAIKPFFGKIFCNTISSYSLAEFLVNNDRRKLKRCPYCGKFFIATDIKRQRCYSMECQKKYERIKKRKQREEDPVRYL